jgi:hypothetical protein
LVANGVVIASSYGNARFDNAAKAQLQQLFPTRDIVMTDTRELWYNGGAVHCVTNDQPLLLQGTTARAFKANNSVPQVGPTINHISTSAASVSKNEAATSRVNVDDDGIIWPMNMFTVLNVVNRQTLSARSVDSAFAELQNADIDQLGLLTSLDALLAVNQLSKMRHTS